MLDNLKNIQKYINDSFEFAKEEQFHLAIEHFDVVRYLLRTSVVNENTPQKLLDSNTNVYENEARYFNQNIMQNTTSTDTQQEVVIVGDSLQLPRPEEKKLSDEGIHLTTSFMLQESIRAEAIDCCVNTWGQRYFTTSSLLENWEKIIPHNLEKSHFVVHLGLNDYVERMFLEEERLAMNLYPESLKNEIVDFARKYRIHIINRQLNHSYVPFEQYKKNLISIIEKAQKSNVKSISLVNIISFPPSTWSSTPRCMWNTSRFNMHLYQLEQEYNLNIIDLDRLIWYAGINDHLLADKMHLSPKGHKILSDEILKIIKDNK